MYTFGEEETVDKYLKKYRRLQLKVLIGFNILFWAGLFYLAFKLFNDSFLLISFLAPFTILFSASRALTEQDRFSQRVISIFADVEFLWKRKEIRTPWGQNIPYGFYHLNDWSRRGLLILQTVLFTFFSAPLTFMIWIPLLFFVYMQQYNLFFERYFREAGSWDRL